MILNIYLRVILFYLLTFLLHTLQRFLLIFLLHIQCKLKLQMLVKKRIHSGNWLYIHIPIKYSLSYTRIKNKLYVMYHYYRLITTSNTDLHINYPHSRRSMRLKISYTTQTFSIQIHSIYLFLLDYIIFSQHHFVYLNIYSLIFHLVLISFVFYHMWYPDQLNEYILFGHVYQNSLLVILLVIFLYYI